MMMLSLALKLVLPTAVALTCDAKKKPTGVAFVTAEKSPFVGKKAFILKGDVVQVVASEGGQSCVIYHGIHKMTAGFVKTKDLSAIKAKYELKELHGDFYKDVGCEDEDCGIHFDSEGISIDSHLHDHPSSNFNAGTSVFEKDQIILTKFTGSDPVPEKIIVKSSVGGSVEVSGFPPMNDSFNGTYYPH